MTVKKAVEYLELMKWLKGYDNTTVGGMPIANIIDDIIALLKAQEPKRGRWMECEDGWGDTHYQCSECGLEWILNDGTPEENNMNYCPHCGAMDGESDGQAG